MLFRSLRSISERMNDKVVFAFLTRMTTCSKHKSAQATLKAKGSAALLIVRNRLRCRLAQFKTSQQRTLRNDGQREIIPIAALVAGLEVVAVHGNNRTIAEIIECAGDRIDARIADDHETSPYS